MSAPSPGDNNDAPILEVVEVSKSFGGIQALHGISFAVRSGEIFAIIGPNGAGKTTLFNLITGVYAPDQGRVRFDGCEIQGRRIHRLVAIGIARTFQNVELFERMSVLENVLVGQHVRTRCGFAGALLKGPRVRQEEREARARAVELLRFVGLEETAGQRSGDLPFGWQRFLEIARAMAARPRLLLLDEPAAGLNAVETERLAVLLRQIREGGTTLLLVEHDMSLTMGVSDRILVLNQGRMLAEGSPREIQADERVIDAYLGRD
jgi:branched-chain amino acid transport system ATP-binding protein